jgi:hypothetical protein
LEKHLLTYFITGGMPEVVRMWIQTSDIKAIEAVQLTKIGISLIGAATPLIMNLASGLSNILESASTKPKEDTQTIVQYKQDAATRYP